MPTEKQTTVANNVVAKMRDRGALIEEEAAPETTDIGGVMADAGKEPEPTEAN